ncbi:MAG TPA: response regulator [Thermoplasmata archaeon]|nr:response regulator [Thermoplasmata archaeon]
MRNRILIVDDSAPVRLSLEHLLHKLGVGPADLRSAGTEEEAWSAFRSFDPDVVFLDIQLEDPEPEGGGGERSSGAPFSDHLLAEMPAEAIRADAVPGAATPTTSPDLAERMLAANPHLKLIVFTGLAPDDPRVRRMIRRGAFDVLVKPLRAARVREILDLVEQEELNLERTR